MNTRAWRRNGARRSCRGFTLLELMVVVVIIAVLAGLLMPAVKKARNRAKVQQTMAGAHALANAIRNYRTEYGEWPCPNPAVGGGWTNNNRVVISYLLPNHPKNRLHRSFWATPGNYMDPYGSNYVVWIDVTNNSVTVSTPNVTYWSVTL